MFKVVRKRDEKLGSVLVYEGPFHVEYKVGKRVKVKKYIGKEIYGALCFRYLKDAISFLDREQYSYYSGTLHIYKCQTGKPCKTLPRYYHPPDLRAWQNFLKGENMIRSHFPKGTVMVPWVMLEEEVSNIIPHAKE